MIFYCFAVRWACLVKKGVIVVMLAFLPAEDAYCAPRLLWDRALLNIMVGRAAPYTNSTCVFTMIGYMANVAALIAFGEAGRSANCMSIFAKRNNIP